MSDSAFKNLINSSVVKSISDEILKFYPSFNHKEFVKLSKDLSHLELKARVLLITNKLYIYLPQDYSEALKILIKVMKNDKLSGFSLWPFSEYIGQHGLNHFDESMKAMYVLTQKFTSEWAVRPYFLKDHKKVLKYFLKWASDDSHHVRRWISEGSRPLLPWGSRLPLFVMDPTHTIFLLEKLKFDEELYVRKSVANHLNDIAKNHPQVVVEVLRMWEKECPPQHLKKIEWIKRHALRILIKKGFQPALNLMGVSKPQVELKNFKLTKKRFKINEKLKFSFNLISKSKIAQKLIIDYKIDFLRANGSHGIKTFKFKTMEIFPSDKLYLNKSHSLKPITTMTFYPGKHFVSIQVNGVALCRVEFQLTS